MQNICFLNLFLIFLHVAGAQADGDGDFDKFLWGNFN